MARTYRLRHLPKLLGSARKFVDSSVRTPNRREEGWIWNRIAHELNDFPCVEGKRKRWVYGAHEHCVSDQIGNRLACDLYEQLRDSLVFAVGNLRSHPWLGWGLAAVPSSSKVYYKNQSNRRRRHKSRQILKNSLSWDDQWEGDFPHTRRDIAWDYW